MRGQPTGFLKSVSPSCTIHVFQYTKWRPGRRPELERDPDGGVVDRLQPVQVDPGHERHRREVGGLGHEPDPIDEVPHRTSSLWNSTPGLSLTSYSVASAFAFISSARPGLVDRSGSARRAGRRGSAPRLVDRSHARIRVQRLGRAAADEPAVACRHGRACRRRRLSRRSNRSRRCRHGPRQGGATSPPCSGRAAKQRAARQSEGVGLGARGGVWMFRVGHRLLQSGLHEDRYAHSRIRCRRVGVAERQRFALRGGPPIHRAAARIARSNGRRGDAGTLLLRRRRRQGGGMLSDQSDADRKRTSTWKERCSPRISGSRSPVVMS